MFTSLESRAMGGLGGLLGGLLGLALPTHAPMEALLRQHATQIDALKQTTKHQDENYLLRFVLAYPDDAQKQTQAFDKVTQWRRGPRRDVCQIAERAISEATKTGKWDNKIVVESAPHAKKIMPFIGASQIQTIPGRGYLAYVIRASAIDEAELMASVTKEELAEFFIYAKEVNAQVALKRSAETGRFIQCVTANDLTGIGLLSGKEFRDALSLASKETAMMYPGIAGTTVLLNLPPLLSALVKLFTPLFPKAVLDRLKFERGPLSTVSDLRELLLDGQGLVPKARSAFLADLDALV